MVVISAEAKLSVMVSALLFVADPGEWEGSKEKNNRFLYNNALHMS